MRLIGVDRVLAPLLQAEAQRQADDGLLDAAQLEGFTTKLASGDGWPFMFRAMHVSLRWWGT